MKWQKGTLDTKQEVGCAQHAMYKRVHGGACSGANQPVHGKRTTMRVPTPLLCPCLQVSTAPEHARPLSSPCCSDPLFTRESWVTHTHTTTHTHIIHASRESGRGGFTLFHSTYGVLTRVTTDQRAKPAKDRYPATAKPQRR